MARPSRFPIAAVLLSLSEVMQKGVWLVSFIDNKIDEIEAREPYANGCDALMIDHEIRTLRAVHESLELELEKSQEERLEELRQRDYMRSAEFCLKETRLGGTLEDNARSLNCNLIRALADSGNFVLESIGTSEEELCEFERDEAVVK